MSNERMPAEIGCALVRVMKALKPAERSTQETDGERTFTYSTADDIFAAVQKSLADEGLLLEMLEAEGGFELVQLPAGEDGAARIGVQMKFVPVWNWFGIAAEETKAVSYENPRAVIPMIGPYEGMKTCAALRTMAEKTYLRALLKLPTAPGEQAPGAPGEAETSPVYTRDEAQAPGGKSGIKPAKVKEPFKLTKQESEEGRDELIALLQKTADEAEGDAAARIGAMDSVFRKNAVRWGRLALPDQQAVKAKMAQISKELAEGRAA